MGGDAAPAHRAARVAGRLRERTQHGGRGAGGSGTALDVPVFFGSGPPKRCWETHRLPAIFGRGYLRTRVG